MTSSFQPFPIAEFKSGLLTYNEPWVRPRDAFEPLQNAYVYRGSIYKRGGTTLFGRMKYCNYQIIYTAAIAANGSVISGTTAGANALNHPLDGGAGKLVVKMTTSAGLETFTSLTATSPEVIVGTLGDTFTINYTTGAWTLQMTGGVRTKLINIPVVAHYSYTPQGQATPPNLPIMGIKQYINESTNVKKTVIMDTRRAAVYNAGTNDFDPICDVQQTIWVGLAATTTQTTTTSWTNLAPYTISITDGANTITDTPVNSTTGNL